MPSTSRRTANEADTVQQSLTAIEDVNAIDNNAANEDSDTSSEASQPGFTVLLNNHEPRQQPLSGIASPRSMARRLCLSFYKLHQKLWSWIEKTPGLEFGMKMRLLGIRAMMTPKFCFPSNQTSQAPRKGETRLMSPLVAM